MEWQTFPVPVTGRVHELPDLIEPASHIRTPAGDGHLRGPTDIAALDPFHFRQRQLVGAPCHALGERQGRPFRKPFAEARVGQLEVVPVATHPELETQRVLAPVHQFELGRLARPYLVNASDARSPRGDARRIKREKFAHIAIEVNVSHGIVAAHPNMSATAPSLPETNRVRPIGR
jgi:hypothetical protein